MLSIQALKGYQISENIQMQVSVDSQIAVSVCFQDKSKLPLVRPEYPEGHGSKDRMHIKSENLFHTQAHNVRNFE